MFKLMRNTKYFSLLESIRITSNVSGQRGFSEQLAPQEKTINTIKLLGRVGAQPSQRGSIEHPIVTFSVATHSLRIGKQPGELLEQVDWHQVIVFKPQLREFTKNNVTKGQRILLVGKLAYSEIMDIKGKSRTATNVIAEDIICL